MPTEANKPAAKRPKGQPLKYAFNTIRPGKSLEVVTDRPKTVRNAAYSYAKRHNVHLKTEQNDDKTGILIIRKTRPGPKK